MKTQARKRYTFLTSVLLVVGGLVLTCFLWVRAEQRQYAMNWELIDLLAEGDVTRALDLVEAGADPNTRVLPPPPPTWHDLLNRLLHRSPPVSDNGPTAFMLPCGDALGIFVDHNTPLMPIMQSMLMHGANVNARDKDGKTGLMMATEAGHTDQMTLLLEHGASVDLQDDNGDTALHFATDNLESVKVLLKYHANPQLKNKEGITPFDLALVDFKRSPEIIHLLKAAGATK